MRVFSNLFFIQSEKRHSAINFLGLFLLLIAQDNSSQGQNENSKVFLFKHLK